MNLECYNLLHRDATTGCFNQAHFIQSVECFSQAFKKCGKEYGVLVFNVVDLSKINSDYGICFGDQVLRKTARQFMEQAYGLEIFRVGGSKLAVVSEDQDLLHKIEKEFKGLQRQLEFRDPESQATVSVTFSCQSYKNLEGPHGIVDTVNEEDAIGFYDSQKIAA